MADTTYNVKTKFTVAGIEAANNRVRKVGQNMAALASRIKGSTSATAGLTRNLLAIGATYVGINAVAGAFKSLVANASSFNAQTSATKIGIATMMNSIEDSVTSVEQGMDVASDVFDELQKRALLTTATSQDLNMIFKGIYGPLRNAGTEMSRIFEMTTNAANAAAALGVDMEQATRDMSLMARGAAGLDVKTFSIMRSMGLIKEDAKEFNKLGAPERIAKLEEGLAKAGAGSKVAADTWNGVTSSLKDFGQQFRQAYFGPIFDAMAMRLIQLRDFLLTHSDAIKASLTRLGEAMAGSVGRMMDSSAEAFKQLYENFDGIERRVTATVERFRELLPILANAAKLFAAVQIGGMVAAPVLAVGGAAATGVGAAGAAAASTSSFGVLAMILGGPVAAAVALVSAGLVALAGVALVVSERWFQLQLILGPMFQGLGTDLMALGKAIWKTVAPALKLLGEVIVVGVVGGLSIAIPLLRLLARGFAAVFQITGHMAEWIYSTLKPAFDTLFMLIEKLGNFLNGLAASFSEALKVRGRPLGAPPVEDTGRAVAPYQVGPEDPTQIGGYAYNPLAKKFKPLEMGLGAPPNRNSPTNNFNGKIVVKQEFKEADPDRVIFRMASEINRQAEMRIQSGFAPALTR